MKNKDWSKSMFKSANHGISLTSGVQPETPIFLAVNIFLGLHAKKSVKNQKQN